MDTSLRIGSSETSFKNSVKLFQVTKAKDINSVTPKPQTPVKVPEPSNSVEPTNPLETLASLQADFTTAFDAAFPDSKSQFYKNNHPVTIKIAKRVQRMFSRFKCSSDRKRRDIKNRSVRSTGEPLCDAIIKVSFPLMKKLLKLGNYQVSPIPYG